MGENACENRIGQKTGDFFCITSSYADRPCLPQVLPRPTTVPRASIPKPSANRGESRRRDKKAVIVSTRAPGCPAWEGPAMGEVESVRCKFTAILAQKQNEVKRLCFLGAHSLLTDGCPRARA